MKSILILIAFTGLLGCKSQTLKNEPLKVDFAALSSIPVPMGCPLLEDPFFQTGATQWPDSVLVTGREWQAYQLDSLLLDSYVGWDFPSTHHQGDSIPLIALGKQARMLLDSAVLDFEMYRQNPKLVPQGYSVIGPDTVVFLRSDTPHNTIIVDEMESYISYTLLACVQNGKLVDYLVLAYNISRMYDQPVRHFYIHRQEILLTTVYFGETEGSEGFETWRIHNHRFVRKQR